MAGTTIDTTGRIIELSDVAFQAFCEGISGMFGADVRCDRQQAGVEAAGGLLGRFKKLTVVHPVVADGILNGTFHLVFDQAGLFVLSGVVIMLPEGRILEQVKRGSMDNTESLQDAAKEVGNLLVGSWDAVFREQCPGHKHFVKKASVIGKLWEKPGQMELSADDQALIVLYEMTVEPYPRFACAAVFPKSVLANVDDTDVEHVGEAPKQQEPVGKPQQSTAIPQTSEAGGDGKIESPGAAQTADVQPDPLVCVIAADGAAPAVAAQAQVSAESSGPPAGPSPAGPPDNTPPVVDPDAHGVSQEPDPVAPVLRQSPAPNGGLIELLQTPAAQIMERDLVWAGPDDTVQSVVAKMQQHNTGYVLIGQNGTLEGLVSNSSILGAVSLYLRPVFAKWRRPEDDATLGVKVKWIMSRPVRTIRPDTTLEGMIESMRRYGGRCLPVVDDKGTVQGIVTTFDILLHVLQADRNVSWKGKAPQAPAMLL